MFFKIAEGYGGHTQSLALFEASKRWLLEIKSEKLSPAETTLRHVALNISLEDFESEKMRLEGLGLKVDATVHEWFFVFARYTSPTQSGVLPKVSKEGICWSLSVTMRVYDSVDYLTGRVEAVKVFVQFCCKITPCAPLSSAAYWITTTLCV